SGPPRCSASSWPPRSSAPATGRPRASRSRCGPPRSVPPRPTDAERRRLHALFAALCAIDSPSGHEEACAAAVAGELEALGLAVERDDFGNLLARIPPPPDGRSILLCAHLDTVPRLDPSTPIEPVEVDEGWENAHDDILGA